jgi:hypothetical protein
MQDKNKKYSLGVAALVVVLGLVAVLVSTNAGEKDVEDELMGSADEDVVTVDDIGPPPALVIDPDVSLSGALTPDRNFYQFERNTNLPDSDDLDESASRENWTALVFDDEYDSINEFLNENTDLTDQLTLAVVWDSVEQDWDVYPNEIFRSDYNIDTLNIFDDEFDGTLIFNTSRSYSYADHVEDRVGDFDVRRGWNYGPKPDFSDIDDKAVVFWEGDVTGNAERLTAKSDFNKAVDKDFFDDLDDDEVYWFYVKGSVGDSCDDDEAFVCGVDGNTYQNSCTADAEDVDVDYDGKCKNDRVALIGEIEDTTLETDETLVLEFFESASDRSAEDLDMDEDEIDLDDSDSDLAIYKKNGAKYEFVTAFSASNVELKDDSVEIDLDEKLSEGDYQLRIFDTFEREKVKELELDFEVEAAEPGEGPALALAAEDEEVRPSESVSFESVAGGFEVSEDFQNISDFVKIYRCENASCSNKTDIASEVGYSILEQEEELQILNILAFEPGSYEVEIEDAGFVYDDGRTVAGDEYEFDVVVDLAEVTYKLKSVEGTTATFEPSRVVSEIGENEALDNFSLYEDGVLVSENAYEIRYDDTSKEVEIELIGTFYMSSTEYEVRVERETNLYEEWKINQSVIKFNGPAVVENGPKLSLEAGDDNIDPEDTVNLVSGKTGNKIELVSGKNMGDALDIMLCDSYTTCNNKTALVPNSVGIAADGMSVELKDFGFPNGGIRMEISVNSGALQYEDGSLVEAGVYYVIIAEQG